MSFFRAILDFLVAIFNGLISPPGVIDDGYEEDEEDEENCVG